MSFDPIGFKFPKIKESVLNSTEYSFGGFTLNDIILGLCSSGGGEQSIENGASAFWDDVRHLEPHFLTLNMGTDMRLTVNVFSSGMINGEVVPDFSATISVSGMTYVYGMITEVKCFLNSTNDGEGIKICATMAPVNFGG